jgi:hypothetical protein
MTAPISNAHLDTPPRRETQSAGGRGAAQGGSTSPVAADDAVQMTQPTPPPPSDRIQSAADAKATAAKLRGWISADPQAALAAQGAISAQQASGTLRTAA